MPYLRLWFKVVVTWNEQILRGGQRDAFIQLWRMGGQLITPSPPNFMEAPKSIEVPLSGGRYMRPSGHNFEGGALSRMLREALVAGS